ncbi:MAG: hypothetical protein GTO41_13500 [Burkholderiales bacterium]|nr:hypothetical protein [Burkholderiales bacterium]
MTLIESDKVTKSLGYYRNSDLGYGFARLALIIIIVVRFVCRLTGSSFFVGLAGGAKVAHSWSFAG